MASDDRDVSPHVPDRWELLRLCAPASRVDRGPQAITPGEVPEERRPTDPNAWTVLRRVWGSAPIRVFRVPANDGVHVWNYAWVVELPEEECRALDAERWSENGAALLVDMGYSPLLFFEDVHGLFDRITFPEIPTLPEDAIDHPERYATHFASG